MTSPSPNELELSKAKTPLPIYRPNGRALGFVLEHITARGINASSQTVSDLPAILQTIVELPVRSACSLFGIGKPPLRTVIDDVSTVLYPGETMLVLGRPGAGCSSVLKIMANHRDSYKEVHGDVQYAGISSSEMKTSYQSEAVYCSEDDIHFPKLPVKDTLGFALRARQPHSDPRSSTQFAEELTDQILQSLGLSHTKNTIVGDAFVRGVSGGERKRISLAEVLAVNPAIACWDNPIRGLDSSSALDFLSLIQGMSRSTQMSNAVCVYQASDAMYKFFDRVLVMYEGRMIYTGRADKAKEYFQSLGFHCPSSQTIPDFLTAVTSPSERTFEPGYNGCRDLGPDTLAKIFRDSKDYQQLQQDIARYRTDVMGNPSITSAFREEVQSMRASATAKTAVEPAAIWSQTLNSLLRQYQLLWGERGTLLTVCVLTAINAVIVSTGYFKAPATATGSFERSGGLFFSLVYFTLNALTEVSKTVHSRRILLKQHQMGFIHPTAYVLAQTIAEIPVALFQSLIFACCFYFTIGLDKTASQFWIYLLIVFTHFGSISCLFRMLGAWSPNLSFALQMAGSALPVVCLYTGYAPPVPTMHRWGSWIRRISPGPWGMEALMANEYSHLTLECTQTELIPHGPGYGNLSHQGCPMPGAQKGSAEVAGSVYLTEQYGFHVQNLWRNFGIMVAFWVIYVILTALGLSIMTRETSASSTAVFRRGARHAIPEQKPVQEKDVESQEDPSGLKPSAPIPSSHSISSTSTEREIPQDEATLNAATFVFKDVSYFVNAAGKEKQLLQNVTGYVRPGQLTALMGASGAGKTTLLDTISQRKSEGRTEGQQLFGGKPLDSQFARSCGFCMQQDVHEPRATVREALQFSALLRQEAHVSDEEKIQYAEEVLQLLELELIADALVGSLGVEERKRVTIGVELAAKPSALLFLDEPTSGLDSQAAFSIVSFLRKIAAQGVPIVCTIHQPSGVIFGMFDHVLILAPGGKTVYFGETGLEDAATVKDYFGRHGGIINEEDNPAESIITTIADKSNGLDWPQMWSDSRERKVLDDKVGTMVKQPEQSPAISHLDRPSNTGNGQFALPLTKQILLLTQRHWISVWRDGPYNFSKLFKTCFFLLLVSFTFFRVGSDAQGLQNHALALLLMSWLIPSIAADIQAVWFEKWAIFEARERNGIYDYKALLIAIMAVEIPSQIILFTVAFFCSYWTLGFPNTPAIAGFIYFMLLLLSLFGNTFCHMMASMFPNEIKAGYANSLFWVILLMFGGVVVPHQSLNDFYRPWMFWVDPLRYYFGATVSSVLHEIPAKCKQSDMAIFDPPSGQTCEQYMQSYMASNAGYLSNPAATADCAYCQYSVGDDYSATMDFAYGDRWWNWAVFLGFCLTNFLVIFAVSWFTRVQMRRMKK